MVLNNITKMSRTTIRNCPALRYFIQYLGYVIKWYRRLKLKDRSNHIAMTFNMAYSAIRIAKNKAIIQSAIVMAFLYPKFLAILVCADNAFKLLSRAWNTFQNAQNYQSKRQKKRYAIYYWLCNIKACTAL